MTIDPQVLRSEQHVEVGAVLRQDADAILERWAHRAALEQPQASRVHHDALLDDLPRFLKTLGESLSAPLNGDDAPHEAPAAAHGVQRWENGWSLGEVVQDYQILRRVLMEYLEETLPRPLDSRESAAVGLALDEAIASSVTAYVGNRDTYVRRVEQSLREQADALLASDRHKNDFLAMLAHELRNPLAPILHAVEVLRLVGAENAALGPARDIIERQVKQMARLVDDLLDVTRIAQGKLELRRTRFELAEAVTQAAQTTKPLFEALNHRLSVQLPAGPLALEADRARVVQVLVNLLANAAKYTDRGGDIRLSAAREDGEAVVRVTDNGIGIEAAMLGRIFDLFTQVDRSLDRSQGGLGIGLTLVRRLVELHGGRVAAHSDGPGKGCEFMVRLPAAEPVPTPARTEGLAAKTTGCRRILIVEDNADARSSLATLLTLLGHQVETAASGPAGIERALAAPPEVALIDLGLPGVDGYEVARRVRAALGAGVRLIALTGYAQERDRQRTREAGFDAHLVKPVEVGELNRALAATSAVSPGASPSPPAGPPA